MRLRGENQGFQSLNIRFEISIRVIQRNRVFIHKHNAKNVASERKYALIGCAIHNLSWTIVLILDFWVYY